MKAIVVVRSWNGTACTGSLTRLIAIKVLG